MHGSLRAENRSFRFRLSDRQEEEDKIIIILSIVGCGCGCGVNWQPARFSPFKVQILYNIIYPSSILVISPQHTVFAASFFNPFTARRPSYNTITKVFPFC